MLFRTGLACAFHQPKQRGPFIRSSSTADHNDDAMMRSRRCELRKIVPVTCQEEVTTLVCKLEDSFVGGISRRGFPQQRDTAAELFN